jgi:Family of unknown function (DUF6499)/Uncharacterized conserved protein (DUF2285)
MPDWRNPDGYSYLKRLQRPQDWAWEFLRRNLDYRAAWAEMSGVEAALGVESNVELVQRRDDLEAKCFAFGLVLYRNPELTAFEVGSVPWVGEMTYAVVHQGEQATHHTVIWPGVPTVPAFSLSYDKDMDPSFAETAMRALDHLSFLPSHRSTIRFRPDDFVLYFRLLDAKRAGASVREMGRVLYGERVADSWKSAQKALRAAKRMAAERYKELLALRF